MAILDCQICNSFLRGEPARLVNDPNGSCEVDLRRFIRAPGC